MRTNAAVLALIPALLVAVFIVAVLSGAPIAIRVLIVVVFVGSSLVLLYRAGTMLKS
jgi:hypothetical protein